MYETLFGVIRTKSDILSTLKKLRNYILHKPWYNSQVRQTFFSIKVNNNSLVNTTDFISLCKFFSRQWTKTIYWVDYLLLILCDFHHATAWYATHGIAIAILSVRPSARLSVCLSVKCEYCDKTKWCTADILIPHETAITLVFGHQHWLVLVGDAPFPVKYSPKVTHPFEKRRLRPISAHNVSTVGVSEKKSNYDEYKVTRAFQRAIHAVRMLPLSPLKGGSKSNFFVFWVNVNGWSSQELST